jgi:hypothetical protein
MSQASWVQAKAKFYPPSHDTKAVALCRESVNGRLIGGPSEPNVETIDGPVSEIGACKPATSTKSSTLL